MSGNAQHLAGALAWILASASVATAEPVRSAPEAERHYATVGGSVYRLVASTPPEHMLDTLDAGAAVDFEVAVAGRSGAFELVEMLRPGAIAWLDAPPEWPAGRGPWSTVLAARISVEHGALRLEYVAGDDRVALSIPEEGILPGVCGPGDVVLPPVVIEVNSNRVAWTFDERSRSMADLQLDPKGLTATDPLAGLGHAFVDAGRFWNAYLGAGLLLDDLRRESRVSSTEAMAKSPCTVGCLHCAGGVVATTGSIFALIGACGATVATAGGATPACIGALMLHEATAWASVVVCADCADCQSRRRRQSRYCDCSRPEQPPRCQAPCGDLVPPLE